MPRTPLTSLYATAAALAFAAALALGPWWAAVAGLLAPDLPLLAGAGKGLARGQLHPRAVPAYNLTHRFLIAAALCVLSPAAGLAWAAHIAVDRAVGYGLRDEQGFQRA